MEAAKAARAPTGAEAGAAPPVEVVPLTSLEFQESFPSIVAVYAAAFALPPYSLEGYQVDSFARACWTHPQRKGFRCWVARAPDNGQVLGFTYGFTGEAGQWWHDAIAARLDVVTRDRWLGDYFELAELAVLPSAQGRGYGGRLHDLILGERQERTSALSTRQSETPALGMYRKRGWVVILPDFVFPGGTDPYLIMGFEPNDAGRSFSSR